MRQFALALFATVLTASPALAQSRLAEQSVRGWKRVCTYEMLLPVAGRPGAQRRQSLEVGRGEPCPARYSPPRQPLRPAQRAPAERPR